MYGLIDPNLLLNSIYESAIDFGIVTLDRNRMVTSWNKGAELIFGYIAQEMVGQPIDSIYTSEDRRTGVPGRECRKALLRGRAADYRWHLRKDNKRFWADGVMTPIYDERQQHVGFLKIMRDVTEKKLAEHEIHQLSNFDALTGLPNRVYFDLQLKELMASRQRHGRRLTLHALDLDHFKDVNDTLGHQAGDLLLKQVAQRLRALVRDTDIVGRIGGDEFMVLQPDIESMQTDTNLAARIIESLSATFHIGQHELQIGCTIGIAVCPDDGNEPEQLLRHVDRALDRAKDGKRGSFQYFTQALGLAAHTRARNLSALRRAVRDHDFWLAYQPKIDCQSGNAIAVEALLRFTSPQLAAMPLLDLVDLADESGLMADISFWVLRESCSQIVRWRDAGLPTFTLCVNFGSRVLMNEQTPDQINAILDETGMAPETLEIEITERQAIDIGKSGIGILEKMRSHGISIALDDFGTGYSALSYLTTLPVNTVKLDQTFLANVPQDREKTLIAHAIIKLMQALRLRIVAEGVESAAQVEFLREADCNALQGYFYSMPLGADDMTAWFARNPQLVGYGERVH